MFIDRAEINVKAGDGGNGCSSFRREAHVPRGGPDGGDGGNGGSVFLHAADDIDTLLDFVGKPNWKAQRGFDGTSRNMHGKDGQDLIIKVPVGTIVIDKDFDLIIKDLNEPDMIICVAEGGKGGKGNQHFATPTNQVPKISEQGTDGRSRNLKLELKLIADIGLVGLPNAGKSTLLASISAAKPKIASYPFTTLKPSLGIVELTNYRRFVVADIPGLIEGAAQGHGLGHDFLRHIERTRLIIHLVDIANIDGSDPVDNYHCIRKELEEYSPKLASKPEILVASKMDLDPDGIALKDFQQRIGTKVHQISAFSQQGLEDLKEILWKEVQIAKELD